MKYRAEIDGLRALAVIPVILFHAGFELFSGGFVGVDIFFVISGYLITTILIEDIENKRFNIFNFYEKRARRILPALFFIMLVCIPFAWMLMLPNQMKDFSQSLIAVSLFISNILFWRKSNYFDTSVELKPLLHTWSLAIEEQYYLLFPIFLILAWRFGKNKVFWMIVVMAAISLMLSEWGWRNKSTANFYLAPTRAWELFSGSITAFIVQKDGVKNNNPLALLGLAAIVFSIFSYDKSTPFPSVYTLVPVVGVVLLILYANEKTLVARIFKIKALVGLGLISYSAYLWHQPLFSFTRIKLLEHPSQLLMLSLSALSIMLAYFSWSYVEKPFRNKEKINRVFIFRLSFIGLILFSTFGFYGNLNEGYKSRLDDEIIAQRLYNEETKFEVDSHAKTEFSNDNRKKILIIGDSYAKDVIEGLVTTFENEINSFDIVFRKASRRCKNVLADTPNLIEYLYPTDNHCFGKIQRIGNSEWRKLIEAADLVIVRSYWDVLPTFEMPRTYDYIDSINPQRVIFIGTTIFGTNNPFKSLATIKNIYPNMYVQEILDIKPYSKINNNFTTYDLIIKSIELMKDRNYFDVFGFFCSQTRCRITDEYGYPLTNDLAHLTSDGERFMFKMLFDDERFSEIWGKTIGIFPQKK